MKQNILKITMFTLLGAAILTAPAVFAADEPGTNAPAAKKTKSTANKFYGSVTAVDTNAMTFTVAEQTYVITSKSKITKNDQPATLADAVVGEPARGSYEKNSEGKLEITKVRWGKKAGGGAGGKKKKNAAGTAGTTEN